MLTISVCVYGGERIGGEILHPKRHGCDECNAIVNENMYVTRCGHGMSTCSVSAVRDGCVGMAENDIGNDYRWRDAR